MYHVRTKGWLEYIKPDMPTPGSGSGSSQARDSSRRFRKVDANGLPQRATAANSKRKTPTPSEASGTYTERVLTHDEDEESHDDPFGDK